MLRLTPRPTLFPYTTLFRSLLVPDNLKSGVNKASFYDPEINRSYGMMATHYGVGVLPARPRKPRDKAKVEADRKSTRLNSSHVSISYAVFCLKKKKTTKRQI